MADRWTMRDFVKEYLEWSDDDFESLSDEEVKFYLDERLYTLSLTLQPPTLEELGLELRDTVRFRERPGANWKTGTVFGTNKDGSVVIHQDSNGFSRSIHVEFIEKKGTGKRGGEKWIGLTPG